MLCSAGEELPGQNGCVKARGQSFWPGMDVSSTVPVLVAGIVPAGCCQKKKPTQKKPTSPKGLLRVAQPPTELGERKPRGLRLAQGLTKWLCWLRWCLLLPKSSSGWSWQPAAPRHCLVFSGWGTGGGPGLLQPYCHQHVRGLFKKSQGEKAQIMLSRPLRRQSCYFSHAVEGGMSQGAGSRSGWGGKGSAERGSGSIFALSVSPAQSWGAMRASRVPLLPHTPHLQARLALPRTAL